MKFAKLFLIYFWSVGTYANEWIEVGNPIWKTELNLSSVESELWAYMDSIESVQFASRESYKFQYKLTKKHEIYINAFCQPNNSEIRDIGALPQPSDDELTKEIYEVFDGGSCFFRVNYNTKTKKFYGLDVNGNA